MTDYGHWWEFRGQWATLKLEAWRRVRRGSRADDDKIGRCILYQRVYLIVNPHSGHGGQHQMLRRMKELIAQQGRDVIEHITTAAGDATNYARSIHDDDAAVLVFGGDGTVNEVCDGLAEGNNLPLLIAAAGTENLLAKHRKMPQTAEGLIELLNTGQVCDTDVGVVSGRHFHSIVGVGFDAEVVRRVTENRTGHITHMSYFWPIWRTLLTHKFPHMRIWADDELVFVGKGMAFVGNISRYTSGLQICFDARSNDGLLDLVVFDCDRRSLLIWHAFWTAIRKHRSRGGMLYKQAKQIRIESEPDAPCEVDGDVGPPTPLEISLAAHKNRLIIPATTD